MKYIAIVLAAASAVLGSWQNNLYVFLFGCAWLIASAILFGAAEVAREIKAAGSSAELAEIRDRVDNIYFAFDPLARSVGDAVNEGIARGWHRKRGA